VNINPFEPLKYLWLLMTSEIGLVLIGLAIIGGLLSRLTNRKTKKSKPKNEVKETIFSHKARITGVDATDTMKGREFEKWLAVKFQKMGYQVHLKSGTKDQGADLILKTKTGERISVQAKKSTKKNIGVAALGDIVRAMRYYQTPKGIVVTNQYFTKDMREEASNYSDIELWDRERLVDELSRVEGFKETSKPWYKKWFSN